MKQRILTLMTALALLLASMPGSAFYYSWGSQTFANATLHEVKIIAVNVDPPIRSMNDKLRNYGVSDIELEKKISQRLRDAGFNIISTEQALADPEAAQLKLRIRMIISHGTVYSYGLDLSLNQKAPLSGGSNSFYSIRTWSDGLFGGTQQTSLRYLNNYSMQLVENFIEAHRAQN
ncbi:MAG: hypothetical protein A3G42_03915 [Gammaproteobacteria bacterium RIFCSPLOWO2_12_FULL_47_76]|nr:MAG: hypothetical protein A3G42_03915 [Gammaproteobacteria bacterium RIFCSPLOWO2_12_FULL_47_76]